MMGADTPEYSKDFVEQLTTVQLKLLSFVASMLPFSREDIPDVVQEVNLAIISHAKSYQVDKPFEPWALRIARNKTIDWLRAKKKERSLLCFDSEVADFAEQFFAEQFNDGQPGLLARLNVCRGKLPPEQSQLLDLHYDKGLTCSQIAKRLNRKKENVHAQLVYVRRKLGECMRNLCKMDDKTFEHLHPTAVDVLFANVIDKKDTSRTTTADFFRLISNENALTLWFYQATVHELLSRQQVSKRRHFYLPASIAASLLAVFAYASLKHLSKHPETLESSMQNTKVLAAVVSIAATASLADDYTWLATPSSADWDKSSSNWDKGAWVDGKDAVFNATSRKDISVTDNVSAKSISVNSDGYSFSGDKTLTVQGAFTVGAGAKAEISAPLASTSDSSTSHFIKQGAGELSLSGANSLKRLEMANGKLTFAGGKTEITTSTGSGTFANSTFFMTNGTIEVNGGAEVVLPQTQFTSTEGGEVIVSDGTFDASKVSVFLNAFTQNSRAYDKGIFTIKDKGVVKAMEFRVSQNEKRPAYASTHGVNILSGGLLEVSGPGQVAMPRSNSSGFLHIDGGTIRSTLDDANARLFGMGVGSPLTESKAGIIAAWKDTPITIGEGGFTFKNAGSASRLYPPLLSGAENDGGVAIEIEKTKGTVYHNGENTYNGPTKIFSDVTGTVAIENDANFGTIPATAQTNVVSSGSDITLFASRNLELNPNRTIRITSNSVFQTAAANGVKFRINGEIKGDCEPGSIPGTTRFISTQSSGSWTGTSILAPGKGMTNAVGRFKVYSPLELTGEGTTLASAPSRLGINDNAAIYVQGNNKSFSETAGRLLVSGGTLTLHPSQSVATYIQVSNFGQLEITNGVVDIGNNEYLNALTSGGKTTISGNGVLKCGLLRLSNFDGNMYNAVVNVNTGGVVNAERFYLWRNSTYINEDKSSSCSALLRFDGGKFIAKGGGNCFFVGDYTKDNGGKPIEGCWPNVRVEIGKGGAQFEAPSAILQCPVPLQSGDENDGGIEISVKDYFVMYYQNTYKGPTVVKKGTLLLRSGENSLNPESTLVIWPGAAAELNQWNKWNNNKQPVQTIARVEGGGTFSRAQYLTVTEAIAPSDGQGGAGTLTFSAPATVSGKLEIDAGDCWRVAAAGQDVSNITVDVNDISKLDRKQRYVFFSAPQGYTGTFKTGNIADTQWSIRQSATEAWLVCNTGTVVMLLGD